jgi:RNA polymerase sigma factor (sigma-70 family)
VFRSVCAAYRRRVSDISPLAGENDEKGNDRNRNRECPSGQQADRCGASLRHRVASVRDGTRACQIRVARRNMPGHFGKESSVKPEAFEEVFELNFDAVYGYLARRVGPDLARDLASETFTRAFAARRRFDAGRGEVRPWLFGIAHNLLRHHYRDEDRRLRALARLDVPDAADEKQPPDQGRLAEALAGLSPEERDVLLLFAWADLSYEQIAGVLEIPLGTVQSRLHRARAHVRAALTGEEAFDG